MGSSRFDKNAVMQSLMGLGPSLEDLLLSSDSDGDSDGGSGGGSLAREEARLEREIVRVIHSGDWEDALRPNSGQSVAVGDHHVCVGFHHDRGSDYRVWEWHGHIMLFRDSDADADGDDDFSGGYSPEYVYGNYFQKLPPNQASTAGAAGVGGLRDLISGDSSSAAAPRVLHRHVNAAASK